MIKEYPKTDYAIIFPNVGRRGIPIVAGSKRGGGDYDNYDIGWLEVHPEAAKTMNRSFIDIQRLVPAYEGLYGSTICVSGSPQSNTKQSLNPKSFTCHSQCFETPELDLAKISGEDRANRHYLEWGYRHDNNDTDYPEPYGISGGGIWAINEAQQIPQLIGIEFQYGCNNGYKYIVGQKIHCWLEMLKSDCPELSQYIDPILNVVLIA